MSSYKHRIILASSSPYRKALLQKILSHFRCLAPDIDETPIAGETVEDLVKRLSLVKAQALAESHSDSVVIASDQSAALDGHPLSKPGNFENAFQQLKQQQGKRITFYTGLVVYDPATDHYHQAMDQTHVHFRTLSDVQIERYLRIEQPYNCAGSFKSEGLGVILFDKLQTEDPSALIGLPLIQLIKILEQIGISLPLED